MSTELAYHTPREKAVILGSTKARVIGLFDNPRLTDSTGRIAIDFGCCEVWGLVVSFNGSTNEFRELAAEIIRCADATDAAQSGGVAT